MKREKFVYSIIIISFIRNTLLKQNICTWMHVNNKCQAKYYTDYERFIENKNTCFVHNHTEETTLNQ